MWPSLIAEYMITYPGQPDTGFIVILFAGNCLLPALEVMRQCSRVKEKPRHFRKGCEKRTSALKVLL